MDMEAIGNRGRGPPIVMRRRQVEEHTNQTRPQKEDATDRTKRCSGV